MNYEVHVTLEVFNVTEFINDCNINGVKPVMIETQNYIGNIGHQIMTSSKHSGDNYLDTLNKISLLFEPKYKIIRKKVEIKPESLRNNNYIYYESHLRLKLPIGYNISEIKELYLADDNISWI